MNPNEYHSIRELFHRESRSDYTILPDINFFAIRFKESKTPPEYVKGVVLYRARTYEECISWINGYDSRIFFEEVNRKS